MITPTPASRSTARAASTRCLSSNSRRPPITSPTFPYDSPANIAFDKHGSPLVINHPFATNDPSHFTVLDVYVNDKEHSLIRPNVP